MKGISRRQKQVVRANVHRQKFDLQNKKVREELRKAKNSLTARKKTAS